MENSRSISSKEDAVKTLLKTILDDSNQLVQVSSLDSMKMLYANKAAKEYSNNLNKPYLGEHCYKYMMGLEEQCPFCPLNQLNNGDTGETEVDNGQQVFTVKTKIDELDGEKVFIEYARDISDIRRSERIFKEQMNRLLKSIPQAEGIIHLDLTDDVCLTATGISINIKCFKNEANVNETIEMMASFVPDQKEREDLFNTFSKEALLKAYENGEVEINHTMKTRFDDDSVRYAKAVARLVMNPATNHLE